MHSKRVVILALAFFLALSIPFLADGAPRIIMGEIQGLNCALKGHKCPQDMMDFHVTTEPDFVLVLSVEGRSTVHSLPNLPRDVKVRHVGESVIVTGEVNPRDNSIEVDKFETQQGMFHRVSWSKEMYQ